MEDIELVDRYIHNSTVKTFPAKYRSGLRISPLEMIQQWGSRSTVDIIQLPGADEGETSGRSKYTDIVSLVETMDNYVEDVCGDASMGRLRFNFPDSSYETEITI